MAKLKVNHSLIPKYKTKMISIIQRDVAHLLVLYFRKMLQSRKDSKGNPFPKKKDSTKRQYKKKGWDTEHWLIRTNTAAQINVSNTQAGITLEPADPDDVLKYVKQSKEWFRFNDEIERKIISTIAKNL